MQGTVFFPGVWSKICENLITEAHCLLQHLNKGNERAHYFSVHQHVLVQMNKFLLWKNLTINYCQLTSFLLLQTVKRSVWAAVVGEMKSSKTSNWDSRNVEKPLSCHTCTEFLWSHRHRLSLLTKLHTDVFIRIFLPKLLIWICVTHEGENHILNDALKKQEMCQRGWIQTSCRWANIQNDKKNCFAALIRQKSWD